MACRNEHRHVQWQNVHQCCRKGPHRQCFDPCQDRYIWILHLYDRLRPTTPTADETVGLFNGQISPQTVRNRLRDDNLRAPHPRRGLDLTPARRRQRLAWARRHIHWTLAQWRNVLLSDDSVATHDSQSRCATACMDGDGTVGCRVAHGGGCVLVWAGISHGHTTNNNNNNVVFIKRWFQDGTNITYGYLTLAHKR